MGTIGTGQADGAAEQNPAEAWRSRNLVVLLANGSSLGIQGGSITDASASHLHLVARFVWTEPCVGELLQLSEASGLPRVQQDLMVTKVLQTPDRDADGAADGAAKEETAAAPEAEQTTAADAGGDWRTKNLLVHFEARHQLLRWVHIEGGRIKRCNPQADADLFVGLEVIRCPTVGASLWFKWPTGEGGLVESPICAVLEYGEEAEVAAKEETAAAPEAEQPAAADGGQERTKGNALRKADRDLFGHVYLVEALLMAADLMLRMRHTRRDGFARRFLSMASAGEIARGNDGERIAHTIWAFRAYEEARLDERRQMSDLFVLHTTADDAELVEELRLSLDGVDTKINRLGIGPFTLQDFVNAGFPEADVELLRKLTMQAATRIDRSGSGCTAAQQQAQQQEGSAAHVG